ncbi:MAG: anthranilate synthase component I [Nitrospira bacterium HGW-Nitrospira-1]|nr:MAG: anthranilate synthase component I [Nitrospira bacterium HGW-Nitrospira-1]
MLYPDRKEFRRLSGKGNLIPVYKEILADTFTPVTAFLKLGGAPSFLLESVEGGKKWARYSFIGSRPAKIIKGRGNTVEVIEGLQPSKVFETDNPINWIKKEISACRPVEVKGLPRFFGGLVGYIGYDMARFFEPIQQKDKQGPGLPDFFFMLTDTMLIFDSFEQKIKVVSNVHVDMQNLDGVYLEAEKKIDEIISRLRAPLVISNSGHMNSSREFISNMPKEEFLSGVERSREYVMSGDIVQVVLSQRFERNTSVDPFNIYRALRVINPSPYMYYLDIGEAKIVGSSPEILVRVDNGKIVLRPIAGTRKRGKTEAMDKALEEELKNDPKERAEHIMLVDLGRNDVGRVARTGSVKVTELMAVERYSHVMHLVSNVEGDLREGLDAFDVLASCFPAGTVSGAPKIRAMEIIEEIEPDRRGPYAGSVGYLSYSGNMDTCITIRTLIIKDGKVYVQAGAGIVADSEPEREYIETLNKAKGMMKAVDMAEEGLD